MLCNEHKEKHVRWYFISLSLVPPTRLDAFEIRAENMSRSRRITFVRSHDIDLYTYENNERLVKVTVDAHDLQSCSVMCVLDDISGRLDVQHVCHSTYVKRTTNDPHVRSSMTSTIASRKEEGEMKFHTPLSTR